MHIASEEQPVSLVLESVSVDVCVLSLFVPVSLLVPVAVESVAVEEDCVFVVVSTVEPLPVSDCEPVAVSVVVRSVVETLSAASSSGSTHPPSKSPKTGARASASER